jgi:hypothetical protein
MPAPEIWGPAVWNLFHTLIEQLNENAFQVIAPQMYSQFVKICKFLPCPDCASDATNFLAKVNLSHIKSKVEFRNTFYLFHNWVNARKRKQLFNYGNILIYGKYNIIVVINRFLSVYHTKGNMKMLNESFQRSLIVSTFKSWFTSVIGAFMPAPPKPIEEVKEVKEEPVIQEEVKVEEEPVIQEEVKVEEEPVIQEEVKVEEEPVIQEEVKVEEEPVIQEEVKVEEPIIQEESIVVEEEILTLEKTIEEKEGIKLVEEPEIKKGKKGKKGKK